MIKENGQSVQSVLYLDRPFSFTTAARCPRLIAKHEFRSCVYSVANCNLEGWSSDIRSTFLYSKMRLKFCEVAVPSPPSLRFLHPHLPLPADRLCGGGGGGARGFLPQTIGRSLQPPPIEDLKNEGGRKEGRKEGAGKES